MKAFTNENCESEATKFRYTHIIRKEERNKIT
jgi:hypothetical protein